MSAPRRNYTKANYYNFFLNGPGLLYVSREVMTSNLSSLKIPLQTQSCQQLHGPFSCPDRHRSTEHRMVIGHTDAE
uniref:Uncharacterized protein n=1 Tax=Anguilla anguilla TaxID=7936 RepID=A0A0E9X0M2_ANGAN